MLLISGGSMPVGVHILIGAICVAIIAILLVRALVTQKGQLWSLFVEDDHSDEIGLDAAEKGSRRSHAERVPYDLEKRAIMHKRWLMVGHESQFKKPGDYRTFTIADIPFLIIRGKDRKLRAFHDVCRHRAYTVARKPNGNTPLLSCKYHGWQYESTGKLMRAPELMDRPEFDAKANGLFEIHLKTDSGRFVFVNFATELADAFPWSDISTSSWQSLNFDSTLGWEIEADVNWRIASLLPWFVNPARLVAISWQRKLVQRTNKSPWPRLQYVDDASFICDFGDGRFLLVSALPLDGTKTAIKLMYISGHGKPPSNDVQRVVDAEIRSAIRVLKKLRAANTNLDFRQSAVRERLDKFARHIDQHKRMEKVAGRKINPATRVTGHAAIDTEAEDICNTLDRLASGPTTACPLGQTEELAW